MDLANKMKVNFRLTQPSMPIDCAILATFISPGAS